MASRDQMEEDYEGFICPPQLQNDDSLEALPADNSGTDGSTPFPFLPLQFSPLPPRNLYEYQQNVPPFVARIPGDDCLQAMTSGDGMSPISNLHAGQVNMHHFIPTPSGRTRESGFETNSRIDDPSDFAGANPRMLSNSFGYNQGLPEFVKRRMQGVPFNSSVLRSNHQIAADPLQNSHTSTNLMLTPGIGETDSQDKSGLALGTIATSSSVQAVKGDLVHRSSRLLPAGQNYPQYTGSGWRSTGQAADITVKNELPQASTAVSRESFKRNLEFPPRDSIHDQRRKIMPQTSVQQFSPDLLQNALWQVATSHSMPASTTSANSSIIPSASLKDVSAGGCTRNTSFSPVVKAVGASNRAWVSQHPTASTAFISPIHISATHSASEGISLDVHNSTMSSQAALAKTSTERVVAAENPTFVSPPVDAPPTALARTIVDRSGSARIQNPSTYSKRVAAAAVSSSAHSSASVNALRKALLLQKSSNMTHPSLSEWRKSLPALAALVKAVPGFRASQVPSSMHHIKFQGFDIPPTVGFKCMLCKRDLSFAPEGPVLQPPIAPAVAVLPCGHTFHDHCLLLITQEDQSKDPPCIPCAMGET